MKTRFFFILFMAMALCGKSQDEKYLSALKNAISIVDTCESKSSYFVALDKFSHIAKQKQTEWLPWYYLGYSNVHLAMLHKDADSIEHYADKADDALAIADSLTRNNSEVYCVKALNAIARINVDYMSRGLEYSTKAHNILAAAEKIDAGNPRIYYLQGRFLYGRPKQFGGGKQAAKPYFEKAVGIYKAKADDPIYPHWGKRLAFYLLDVCSKSDE